MPAPFHPTRAFQAYQIFAANTDVGKTILATGLCRAAAMVAKQKNRDVFYLKPVQTGYPVDSDERIQQSKSKNGAYSFIETAGGIHSPVMSGTPQADFYRPLRLPSVLIGDSRLGGISTTLSTYESLALRGYDIPSILLFQNDRYRNHTMLSDQLTSSNHAKGKYEQTLVSTVPAPPTPLEDPVKELESMRKYYEQLDEYMQPVMKHLDQVHEARFDRLAHMEEKAQDILWWPFTQHQNVKQTTVVDSAYEDYFLTYNTNKETQAMEPKEMFDSCASWWTQGLGHANPKLTMAAAHAAGRYGHVMFPETANEPAMALAERVLENDKWASRVFISDNGSTAIEVALKMALRATALRYGWSDSTPIDVLGLEGGYHGDTIGAMDACSPNVFNKNVQWYKPKGHWLQAPSLHISKGKVHVRVPESIQGSNAANVFGYDSLDAVYATDQRHQNQDPLVSVYKSYVRSQLDGLRQQNRHIGALLMEPVIMGSGGMIFVDPLFQRVLVDTVRTEGADLLGYKAQEQAKGWEGMPIIFDEIFAGMYRLGRRSASDFLGVKPDIVGYAKTLTGGLVPLALTVTKESLFDIFLSDKKENCLLHGHSYTAHPIGCAVAGETIDTLESLARVDQPTLWTSYRDNWKSNETWSMWNPTTIDRLSHMENVSSVMSLGSILAVELKDEQGGYNSMISKNIIHSMRHADFDQGHGAGINLFARPLGNVIYLMTSQTTTPERVRQCEDILFQCLEQQQRA
ncbi:pyridoxal phosphate-dependent transferase [Phascolomyces articulosus]|uniref:Pyridoxal phosphate-dependent transferase n=1 Tax=Phascolomyces articulosus TaxID=60185 RepID=A0AAD5K3Z8_9FUNG|nr:pyridoxal phosphate-dependent transferase [Phascolomyces articulosus]